MDEVAATLGVNCGMSTGRNGMLVLNDQGGNRMDVTEEVTCTLSAESHHPPVVLEDTVPIDSKMQTPPPRMESGDNGDQTLFVPYSIGAFHSEGMKSDNPHAGIYEAKTSRTLDVRCNEPSCQQGGIAIVALEGNGSRPSHHGGGYQEGQPMYTLNGTEVHAIAFAQNQRDEVRDLHDKSGCINGEPGMKQQTFVAVESKTPDYIVRRLTPTECARLQGFPDWWCSDLGTENPTEEDIRFWQEVWETHRQVISHAKRPKTEKQIRAWLADPHTDSAEYRMWGNGISLPIPYFVLSGIVWSHFKDINQ